MQGRHTLCITAEIVGTMAGSGRKQTLSNMVNRPFHLLLYPIKSRRKPAIPSRVDTSKTMSRLGLQGANRSIHLSPLPPRPHDVSALRGTLGGSASPDAEHAPGGPGRRWRGGRGAGVPRRGCRHPPERGGSEGRRLLLLLLSDPRTTEGEVGGRAVRLLHRARRLTELECRRRRRRRPRRAARSEIESRSG